MRRRQPDDISEFETAHQPRIKETLDELASLVETLGISAEPELDEDTAEEEADPGATVTQKRTLLTQALLIKEQPQQPALMTTEESKPLLIRGASKPPRLARRAAPQRSWRRGLITQIAVTLMATALLIGGITTTTPLGRNIADITGF